MKKLIKAVAKYCKEFMLSLNSDSSYLYARNVKGRFKLGEKAISKNSNLSLNYARYVLSGRFELGEKAISQDSHNSLIYARDVIEGRFELGEYALSQNCYDFYYYANQVIKSRFKLGEKNYKPIYSELYVGLIPDFRFHESLFWYTYYVIKFNHE